MKKQNKKIWIIVLIILIALFASSKFIVPAFLNRFYGTERSFPDTNTKKISINETYSQGGVTFEIDKLVVGDTYSVLHFHNDIKSGIITGASLYQNGEELKYISASSHSSSSSKYQRSTIGFEPADGLKNIELKILVFTGMQEKEYTYPLEYVDNVATVDIDINGDVGQAIIKLADENYRVDCVDLQEAFATKIQGYPITPPTILLLKDGKEFGTENLNEAPDTLKIITKEVKSTDEVIIIPIS